MKQKGLIILLAALPVLTYADTDDGSPPDCDVAWSEAASACVWEVIELKEPIAVRAVRGTLANEGGGLWPEGVEVVIELAPATNHALRYTATTAVPSGTFEIEAVPPGEYCFRIGVRPLGWCGVQGRIVVSPEAPAEARVEITVPLGK